MFRWTELFIVWIFSTWIFSVNKASALRAVSFCWKTKNYCVPPHCFLILLVFLLQWFSVIYNGYCVTEFVASSYIEWLEDGDASVFSFLFLPTNKLYFVDQTRCLAHREEALWIGESFQVQYLNAVFPTRISWAVLAIMRSFGSARQIRLRLSLQSRNPLHIVDFEGLGFCTVEPGLRRLPDWRIQRLSNLFLLFCQVITRT